MSRRTIIRGLKNIKTNGPLFIGLDACGFNHKCDRSLLNIKGKMIVNGNFSIGPGCRFDIGENAIIELGNGSYINSFTNVIIMHKLTVGNNCAISWECQFLDEDFHKISYENMKDKPDEIVISDNVWIGNKVSIYKGTHIGKGSVIASNSVVKGSFYEENVLIAGNPAKIIKRNISWS